MYAAAVVVIEGDRSYWVVPIENIVGALEFTSADQLQGYNSILIESQNNVCVIGLEENENRPSPLEAKVLYVAERICCAWRILQVCQKFVEFEFLFSNNLLSGDIEDWSEQEYGRSMFLHNGTSPWTLVAELEKDWTRQRRNDSASDFGHCI